MSTISVIITSYNQKDYLREAVESVLSQTLKPYEIIVCDDASSDGSAELIRDYEQKYPGLVKGLLHEKNLGIAKNRNSGINASSGEFITWLDGDDRFRPEKLQQELNKMLAHPDIKWVYSQEIIVDEEGNELHTRYKKHYEGNIFENLMHIIGSEPNRQLIETAALRKIGLFQEDLEMYEDFDLCLRLARHYRCAYCEEILTEYRMHPDNFHKSPSEKHLKSLEKIHTNLKKMLASEPEAKQRRMEHDFLNSQFLLLIQRDIEEGRRGSLFLLLHKRIRNSFMAAMLNPVTYIAFLRIILPTGVFNFLRRIKAGKKCK